MTLTPFESLLRTEFFEGLPAEAVADVAPALRVRQVPAGEVLLEQGAEGDALFVVRHGRLRAEYVDSRGEPHVVGEIAAGEMLGEMAVLEASRRTTTVRAVRDSEVVELPRAAFDTLALQHPEILRRLAALLSRRLQAMTGPDRRVRATATMALVPHGPDVDATAFAHELCAAFLAYREAEVISLDSVPPDHRHKPAALREHLLPRLADAESEGRTLLLPTRPGEPEWNEAVLSQADVIVVVATGGSRETPGEIEVSIPPRLLARRELVLLHRAGVLPTNTRAWLTPGRFSRHHHVRIDDDGPLHRFARWHTGRSLGVAFGGGGARGFAEIGFVRAMAEAGVPIDRVGGTSMGSIMAAEVALGWRWDEMLDRTRHAFRRDPLGRDHTLPLASIFTCHRVVRLFQELFSDLRAEDAWLPWFGIQCNLSRAEPMVRREGPLWQLVRGSSALPGIGPPVIENGDYIVDGAIFDNVPAGLLLDEHAGPVVAINVSPREDIHTKLPDNYALSGWRLLWDRLRGVPGAREYPSMLFVLQRTVLLNSVAASEKLGQRAHLYLHPELEHFDMFGWHRIDEIVKAGHAFFAPRTAVWGASLPAPRAPAPPALRSAG